MTKQSKAVIAKTTLRSQDDFGVNYNDNDSFKESEFESEAYYYGDDRDGDDGVTTTSGPTPGPTPESTPDPTPTPPITTQAPVPSPTSEPSKDPSGNPTGVPSGVPSHHPTAGVLETANPSFIPTGEPSVSPSYKPSQIPSYDPSSSPSKTPIAKPSGTPSGNPIADPSSLPSEAPISDPSSLPSEAPSGPPTEKPIISNPSQTPSRLPTIAIETITPTRGVSVTAAPTLVANSHNKGGGRNGNIVTNNSEISGAVGAVLFLGLLAVADRLTGKLISRSAKALVNTVKDKLGFGENRRTVIPQFVNQGGDNKNGDVELQAEESQEQQEGFAEVVSGNGSVQSSKKDSPEGSLDSSPDKDTMKADLGNVKEHSFPGEKGGSSSSKSSRKFNAPRKLPPIIGAKQVSPLKTPEKEQQLSS